jgi:WD40 repeat protein
MSCAQGTLKHNLPGHSNFVVSVDFHPKTYELASGSYDTKLLLWDGEKGKHCRPQPRERVG